MSERSQPASPRRRDLARKAGVVAHSPTLTTAAAWLGALAALIATGPAQLAQLQDLLRQALRSTAQAEGATEVAAEVAAAPRVSAALLAVASLVLPVVAAAAVAALGAHLAQARAFWIPRRAVPGAPAWPRGAGARSAGGLWALVRAAALLVAGVGWLFVSAPQVAALAPGAGPRAAALGACAALLSSSLLVLAATWVALGALELVGRALALAAASRMTAAETRREQREQGGAVAAWRARAGRAGSAAPAPLGSTSLGLEEATLVVLGDSEAAAVVWEPRRAPEPQIALTRRGVGVSHVLALARQGGVPVIRAPQLARQLVEAGGAAVPPLARAPLAELVVAVHGRRAASSLAARR
ncbi:MAG: EscU/YscU/HrcU family type III secretion system export apparatus switch protein [Myxococcales bacterium]|nr:EscU/YscU/HrcU family type III secretion system export apparatus switch protein [Myxococcales bacterium]